MSRSVLHNWECAIEKLGGENANALLDIAQDIYNTGYVRGKIKALQIVICFCVKQSHSDDEIEEEYNKAEHMRIYED